MWGEYANMDAVTETTLAVFFENNVSIQLSKNTTFDVLLVKPES